MSYEIIYDRKFVRTNKYVIPIVLGGSNNCSEYHNGREVRERNWYSFFYDFYNSSDLISNVKNTLEKSEYELFKWHSKWIMSSEIQSWFKTGIKSSKTIEEYLEVNPSQNIKCHIVAYQDNKSEDLGTTFLNTTSEIDDWIDGFKKLKSDNPNKKIYPYIGFSSPWIKVISPRTKECKVIAKEGRNSYVCYYNSTSVSYDHDISKAVVFDSIEDAKDMIIFTA